MMATELQGRCAAGQDLLEKQQYVEAELELARAEAEAVHSHDWDTLARVYMPLQEARRQRRQRTTEGVACLDLISEGPGDHIEGRHVLENYPHAQLLVAGWGSIEPANQVRNLQGRFKLYVDVLLGAVYPVIGGGHAVVIVPHEHVVLPALSPRRWEDFGQAMPQHSIVLREEQLPHGLHRADERLTSLVQRWWEQLHKPFLEIARGTRDPLRRIQAYRKTINVDYACELAHQELCDTARELARESTHSR